MTTTSTIMMIITICLVVEDGVVNVSFLSLGTHTHGRRSAFRIVRVVVVDFFLGMATAPPDHS